MEGTEIDWSILERLRGRFLAAEPGAGVYWQSDEDLAHYQAFFGARIGWKWDNLLDELEARGYHPRGRQLLDWACGSGVAALRVVERWGAESFDKVVLWDHSLVACRFAQRALQTRFPTLAVEIATDPNRIEQPNDTIALVSHALNELTTESRVALTRLLRDANQILIVEPGDYQSSRLLIEQREALAPDYDIIAPCTHCQSCPMLAEENARHWCHFFGKSPVDAYTNGDWARFATMMAIDLRSLPYSCLVLNHKRLNEDSELPDNASRMIGRPRQFKGYTRLLSCDTHGLRELELQKRDDKALWKDLKKGKSGSLFVWQELEDRRIKKSLTLLP